MKTSECKLTDELFTHQDDDTGVQTTWNATQLYDWCVAKNLPIIPVQVDQDHAVYCFEKRGFEIERIPDIIADPARLKKPILFVAMIDGSHLLVDGTHRYVIYYKLNQSAIPAIIVQYEHAKAFIVTDTPQITEAQLMSPSLLPEIRRAMRRP